MSKSIIKFFLKSFNLICAWGFNKIAANRIQPHIKWHLDGCSSVLLIWHCITISIKNIGMIHLDTWKIKPFIKIDWVRPHTTPSLKQTPMPCYCRERSGILMKLHWDVCFNLTEYYSISPSPTVSVLKLVGLCRQPHSKNIK